MQRSSIRSKARSAQSQPQQAHAPPPVHAHTLQAQMDAAAAASASSHSPVPAASSSFSPDRTREFHSMLESHRHISSSMGDPSARAAAAAAILPHIPKPTPFTDSANHLLSSIRSMSTFLSSQRAEYLDLHRHLSANSSGRRGRALTNADRDKLEAEVNRAVMDINAKIDQLKESIRDPPPEEEEEEESEAEPEDEHDRAARAARALERQQNNADVRAHQHTVIILLFDALRQLAASMAALKTARTAQLKADLEERHPGALAAAKKQDAEREERRMRGAAAGGDNSAAATSTSAAAAAAASSAVDLLPSALGKAVSSSLGKLQRIGGLDAGGGQNGTAAPVIDDGPSAAPSLVFSAQEHLLLQEENHHLLDSLEDNLDAMRRAESQLAAIASLMTLFSTKVLEQEEQIGTIYDQAIKSTLHVHSGISQLKKAAQRGVTFRMMILFMILIMSFSLLFLDWYSS